MGIIKCEQVFARILILILNKLKKLNHSKNFFPHMIPISITCIVFFQFYLNYLKQVDKVT